jgi:hypothetical protein
MKVNDKQIKRERLRAVRRKNHPGDLSAWSVGDILALNGHLYRIRKITNRDIVIRPTRPMTPEEKKAHGVA